MAIYAKPPERTFTPCPEGLHHAVCVDVVDLGVVATSFGDKHKVRIIWQIEEENPDTGRRYDASKQYNLSLHEKSTLRKDLEGWRGVKFTEAQLAGEDQRGFDIEKLVGVNCQIQIVHDISDDARIWANVQAVVPAPKNVPKMAALDYTRVKDRPKDRGNGHSTPKTEPDDPIPF